MTKAVELAQVASTGVSEAFKNRIINGAMVIDQRNAGASSSFGSTGAYNTVDRFQAYQNTSGTATLQQVVDAPAGFYNSLKVTITASATPAAGELFQIQQIIEGYNIADFAFGTASARAITLSFWVKSSLTGQFGGAVQDGSAAYGYPFSYTISAANTWEQKSILITGATAGSWGATTSAGLRLYLDLGCGSNFLGTAGAWVASSARGATGDTKLISTNGATWFITGVQLEVGSTATSFDYRPYGTELQLCQRYYFQITPNGTQYGAYTQGFAPTTTDIALLFRYPVPPRTACTGITVSSTATWIVQQSANIFNPTITFVRANQTNVTANAALTGATAGSGATLIDGNNASFIQFNGMEL